MSLEESSFDFDRSFFSFLTFSLLLIRTDFCDEVRGAEAAVETAAEEALEDEAILTSMTFAKLYSR